MPQWTWHGHTEPPSTARLGDISLQSSSTPASIKTRHQEQVQSGDQFEVFDMLFTKNMTLYCLELFRRPPTFKC